MDKAKDINNETKFDCKKCLYAGCCEYGLTHHPDEMCKTGTDAFKKLNKE